MLESVELIEAPMFPVVSGEKVNLSVKSARLTDKQFWRLCADNPELKFELSATGELAIATLMLPDWGRKNSDLNFQTAIWARKDKTGIVFDSSTIFTLPNGAKRSPDVSWLRREKWEAVSEKMRAKWSKFVPEFVIELRSLTDALAELQAKMREYIENGVLLGWLIDPKNKQVHIYRANGEVEILDKPKTILGEDVLSGFELNLREIF